MSSVKHRLTRIVLRNLRFTAVVFGVGCAREPAAPDPQLVAQWMRVSLAFTRSERIGPPPAARISAYGSLALYEGYAADAKSTLRSLSGQLNGFTPLPVLPAGQSVDGATVAAAAERVVLDSIFRDGFASTRRTIDSLASAQIAARGIAGVGSALRDRSIAHGRVIGAAILSWAATDSFYATRGRPWKPPSGRQYWINTATVDQFIPQVMSGHADAVVKNNSGDALDLERATSKSVFANRPKSATPTTLPGFDPVKPTEPYWGELRTFVIRNGDECAPPPPPAYSEKPGSEFYVMAQASYDTMRAITPEQRATALFWADNPAATGTPAFHWISVINQMVSRRHLSADAAVEVYTLTSIAMADAFIGCWREKYRSYVVRPVTFVQRLWEPGFHTVFPTPPFPEYSSGHSVISGAAVQVMTALLGDTTEVTDSTQMDVGLPPRHFTSFTAALNQVAISRVYGGIHYMKAVIDGMEQGRCIGRRVTERIRTRRPGA